MCFESTFTNCYEKILAKSKHLANIMTFLINNKTIWTFLAGWIVIFDPRLRELTCIIKALMFSFNAALANFFLLISSTLQMVGKVLLVL